MKDLLKEEGMENFLSEEKLDMFIDDIKDMKALWGGDHIGYKKAMAEKIRQMEAARKIYAQKKAFNKVAVASQQRFTSENMAQVKNMGPIGALKELFFTYTLGGSSRKLNGSSDGVMNRADAIFQSVAAPLHRRLNELGAFDVLARGDGQKDMVAELLNLQTPGSKMESVTGNKQMFEAAKAMKSALDGILEAKQAAGMPVKKLDSYIGKQYWAREKVAQFKDHMDFQKYVESTYKIDENKTFGKYKGDPEFKANFYKEMYDNIMSSAGDGVDSDGVGDEFISVIQTKDYYKKQAQGRKVFFKDSDDYLTLINEMGGGNYLQTIIRQLETDARSVALMSKFGTDPQAGHAAMFNRIKRELKKEYQGDVKALAQLDAMKYDTRFGIAGSGQDMFNYVSGKSFTPGTSVKTKVATFVTNLEALSKLGAAGLSALGDLPRSISLLQNQTGDGFLKVSFDYAKSLIDIIPPGSRKEVMKRVATITDQDIYISGFSAEEAWGMGSLSQKIMRTFHKATGLDYITRRTQEAMSLSVNRQFAENTKYSFNDLPAYFKQNYAERYGLTDKSWQVLTALKTEDGYIDIDAADTVKGFTKAEVAQAKQAYFRATTDMAELASGEANSRARFTMTAGKQIDDIEGTARKIVFQFKSFMFAQQHAIERAARSNPDKNIDVSAAARMMMTTAAGWYMAQQIKNLTKGKELDDPSDPKTIAASFIRSGALTPYTELIFGPSRFDANYDETAMSRAFAGVNYVENGFKSTLGPASGLVWDSAESFGKLMAGQYEESGRALAYMTMERAPFKNLWYTKALYDVAIIDNIKEFVDPGFKARRAKRERTQ